MKKSKIATLYDAYVENPNLTNVEAEKIVDADNHVVRTMKHRLNVAGYIRTEEDGSVTVLRPFRATGTVSGGGFKATIYEEMVEAYMEDFRQQATFADRLAVGREIRLILEKM